MNTVLNAVVGDKLILPTLESPTKILDCGTGTGDWAIAVAQQYPECQVYTEDNNTISRPLSTKKS